MKSLSISAQAFLMFALSSTTATTARGHAIVVYTGRMTLQPDQLKVELDLDAHLLKHERRALGKHLSPLQLASLLVDSLVVFTDKGDRLEHANVSVEHNPPTAQFMYAVPSGISALVLMHVPTGALAAQSRQFQLRRSGLSSNQAGLVRLTSGGNYEVVRLDERFCSQTPGVDEFVEPVVRILSSETGYGRRVDIDFPCAVLNAWPALAFDRPVITNDAFRDRESAFKHWISANLDCVNPDGVVGWRLERLSLIAPDGSALGASTVDVGCVYTTRVRFSVSLNRTSDDQPIDIVWCGFHQAMMRMAVVVMNDRKAIRPADLTPTQNVLRIDGLNVVRAMQGQDGHSMHDSWTATGGNKR